VNASQLLHASRARAGLTQRELADRAGTSQAMVNRYERGRVDPSVATLERLLAACGERLELSSRPSAPDQGGLLAQLRLHRAEVRRITKRHHAHRLRVFGSAARGEDQPGSDLDLLVDADAGRMTLVDLAGLQRELSELLHVSVDVMTEQMLKGDARREALRDAVAL
jgi:predicted nucleotidyltransferase/DNA-binding XRE family transcriptional regulator